jgi:uncharacterized membrane protein YesL
MQNQHFSSLFEPSKPAWGIIMKKLSIDNPFFGFMDRLGDIVILNILFLICSVPIITMGASVSAMYQALREMEEDTYISAFKSFKAAFMSSLKKSIPVWLLCFIPGAVLVFDIMFVTRAESSMFWHITGMVTGCLMFLWLMLVCWLFPAAVFKSFNIKEAVNRSMFLAVRNLPYTLLMILLNLLPVVFLFLGDYYTALMAPVYFVMGFSITALVNTKLMERCKCWQNN